MEGTALYKAYSEGRLDDKEYAKQVQNSEEGRARVQELDKLVAKKLRAYLSSLENIKIFLELLLFALTSRENFTEFHSRITLHVFANFIKVDFVA